MSNNPEQPAYVSDRREAAIRRTFEGTMDGLSFAQGVDLSRSSFGGCRSPFQANGARIEAAKLDRSYMENVVMKDGQWAQTTFATTTIRCSTFARGVFAHCDFAYAKLYTVDMEGVDLHGASFVGATFDKVNFAGADLSGADLTGVDLSTCDVTGAHFDDALIAGAKFNTDQLYSCPSLMQEIVEMYLGQRARGMGKEAIVAVLQATPLTAPHRAVVRVSIEPIEPAPSHAIAGAVTAQLVRKGQ